MWHRTYGETIETIPLSRQLPEGLPHGASVLVHLGTNDGLAFHFCRQATRYRKDLRLLFLSHDPPHLPLSKALWMEALAHHRLGRGVRAVANRLLANHFDSELCAAANHWIVMSDAGKRALQARLRHLGQAGAPITVIPHGLYHHEAPPYEAQSRKRLHLGLFGHISPSKGLHVVVDALLDLARTRPGVALPHLLVAGAPDSQHAARYLAKLKGRVARAGLESLISFRGYLGEHELAAFFGEIDALVLPYLRPTSCSASGPLHLAMTYGRPLLCSRSPYFDEAVGETGIGFLAQAGSKNAWRDMITDLVANPESLGDLASAMSVSRNAQTWENVAEGYRRVLSQD